MIGYTINEQSTTAVNELAGDGGGVLIRVALLCGNVKLYQAIDSHITY